MRRKKDIFYHGREYIGTMHELIDRAGGLFNEQTFCLWHSSDSAFSSKSYGEMYSDVRHAAGWLLENAGGIGHAALLGETTYQWIVLYYAMLYCGIVAVPLDRLQTVQELTRQTKVADVSLIFYSANFKDKALGVSAASEVRAYEMTDADVFAGLQSGNEKLASEMTIDPKKLAVIDFTSGTTGMGKGVMLSQRNLMSNVMFGAQIVDFIPGERTLSVMPNNHVFELVINIMTAVYFGVTICLGRGLKQLKDDFKAYQPDVMIVVPALLKAVRNEIIRSLKQKNSLLTFKTLVGVSNVLVRMNIDVRKKLFAQVHNLFGDKIRLFVCGGSSLSREIIDFYDSVGIHIVQGYGLTECAPVVSCNSAKNIGERSLGLPNPYCEVSTEDGEIIVRGDNVMMGYYKDEKQTAEAFSNGWLKTGDLGYVDKDGFVYLTGRKKNLIILSNGENVSPEGLEELISAFDFVNNVMVYGENDVIVAEIFPQEEFVKAEQISNVQKYAEAAVRKLNASLPDYQRIAQVKISKTQFEQTTTLKNKR